MANVGDGYRLDVDGLLFGNRAREKRALGADHPTQLSNDVGVGDEAVDDRQPGDRHPWNYENGPTIADVPVGKILYLCRGPAALLISHAHGRALSRKGSG